MNILDLIRREGREPGGALPRRQRATKHGRVVDMVAIGPSTLAVMSEREGRFYVTVGRDHGDGMNWDTRVEFRP